VSPTPAPQPRSLEQLTDDTPGVRKALGDDAGVHPFLPHLRQGVDGDLLRFVDLGQPHRADVLRQPAVDGHVVAGPAHVVLLLAPGVGGVAAADEQHHDEQEGEHPAQAADPSRPTVVVGGHVALGAAVRSLGGGGGQRGGPGRGRAGGRAGSAAAVDGGGADDLRVGRRCARGLDDVGDDAGHVIGGAGPQRELDELIGARARVRGSGQRVAERVDAHHARQPVGAEQPPVANLGLTH
jgi:hypothetical protein